MDERLQQMVSTATALAAHDELKRQLGSAEAVAQLSERIFALLPPSSDESFVVEEPNAGAVIAGLATGYIQLAAVEVALDDDDAEMMRGLAIAVLDGHEEINRKLFGMIPAEQKAKIKAAADAAVNPGLDALKRTASDRLGVDLDEVERLGAKLTELTGSGWLAAALLTGVATDRLSPTALLDAIGREDKAWLRVESDKLVPLREEMLGELSAAGGGSRSLAAVLAARGGSERLAALTTLRYFETVGPRMEEITSGLLAALRPSEVTAIAIGIAAGRAEVDEVCRMLDQEDYHGLRQLAGELEARGEEIMEQLAGELA